MNMEISGIKLFCVIATFIKFTAATKDRPTETYDMLYTKATRAYTDERWFECKENIQQALADYHWYQDTVSYCRIKCSKQSKSNIYQEELSELHFFEVIIGRSDCVRRCKRKELQGRPESVTKSIRTDFENRKPYDYFQFCAYKNDDVELAAAAVYTYMLKHPDDRATKDNIKFYQTLPGVTSASFRNMESLPHQESYLKAVDFYTDENYYKTISTAETTLMLYHQAYDRCSALCEEPYDHESFPDFYNALADHFISVLKCQRMCTQNLATVFMKEIPNYYEELYNYLQYAYHRVGNLKKAAEAVATYLLFKPDDDTMLNNKQFYQEQPEISEADFRPTQKAKLHYQKLKEEDRILYFIQKDYMTAEDADDTEYKKKPQSLFGDRDHIYKRGIEMFRNDRDLTLVMDENDLGEPDRFVVDGFLAEDDCEQLTQLALVSVDESGQSQEMTVSRIIQLVKNSSVSEKVAKLLFDVAERSKEYMTHHTNILRPLYFHFTQLICGSAEVDSWSQEVSTDNCEVEKEGKCIHFTKARAYSSVLFLTNKQKGGKYHFENDDAYLEKDIAGQCGRLLGFKSNSWYGVSKVEQGTICGIKMWFTLDKEQQDHSFSLALDTLAAMENKKRFLQNPALKGILEDEKITLSMTEDDLNGTERFVALQVASDEECEALVKLANMGGVSGDGYNAQRRSSPHTSHEEFSGLNLETAALLAASQKVEIESVKLYLDISEKAKRFTQTYFGVDKLYFDYTHLVCRTAVDDENVDRDDLSHPIHSDNCHIQPDGSCPRRPPAYAERDYSNLLYLNGNFEGGEFFFAHKNFSVQAQLRPKCGMMVGFNSGNYHGVKAVLSGQRCAVALWYTLDPRYNEQGHIVAKDILQTVDKPQGPDYIEAGHVEL